MSLKDLEYQKPHDMAIFKALKRTFKDAIHLGEMRMASSPKTVDLVRLCYNSRKTHTNEPIELNYTYWPGDIGYGFNTPVLFLLWLVRVLNIVEGRDKLDPVYSTLLGKLHQIEHMEREHRLSIKEKKLLNSNMDLLKNLYIPSKCSVTKEHIKVFINIFDNNTEGIPF